MIIISSANITSGFEWWLGLDELDLNDHAIFYTNELSLSAWLWVIIVLLVGLFSYWSYSRMYGNHIAKISLSLIRFISLLLLIWLITKPLLGIHREKIKDDIVIVLLDKSSSMLAPVSNTKTRFDLAKNAAIKIYDSNLDDSSITKRDIKWYSFTDSLSEYDDIHKLSKPSHQATTDINGAISNAIRFDYDRPIAGIILITDGRDNHHSAMNHFASGPTPIYPVFIEEEADLFDLFIKRIDAPKSVYRGDLASISLWVETQGKSKIENIKVEVIDLKTGLLICEKILRYEVKNPINLIVDKKIDEDQKWQVRITSIDKSISHEYSFDNNVMDVSIKVRSKPLKLLYIDGYPRWEQRYLKNLLIREQSITSSIFLFSADDDFAQEGNNPIKRLPETHEELNEYDALIVGDVAFGQLNEWLRNNLVDAVSKHGLGVIFISGERHMPKDYGNSKIARLLPMNSLNMIERTNDISNEYTVSITDTANTLGILQVSSNISDLPSLHYVHFIRNLKPTAEIIGKFINTKSGHEDNAIAMMHYGEGNTLYIGTDELWRWRYGKGERYYEEFWLSLIRLIVKQKDISPVVFKPSTSRAVANEEIIIDLDINNGLFTQSNEDNLYLKVTRQKF